MTRNEYDEIESYAIAALIGLTAHGLFPAEQIPARAFSLAEEFQKEKLKRLGEKPPFDH